MLFWKCHVANHSAPLSKKKLLHSLSPSHITTAHRQCFCFPFINFRHTDVIIQVFSECTQKTKYLRALGSQKLMIEIIFEMPRYFLTSTGMKLCTALLMTSNLSQRPRHFTRRPARLTIFRLQLRLLMENSEIAIPEQEIQRNSRAHHFTTGIRSKRLAASEFCLQLHTITPGHSWVLYCSSEFHWRLHHSYNFMR